MLSRHITVWFSECWKFVLLPSDVNREYVAIPFLRKERECPDLEVGHDIRSACPKRLVTSSPTNSNISKTASCLTAHAWSVIWLLMKILSFSLCVIFACGHLGAQTNVLQPSPGHTQVPIWPGAAPDAQPVPGAEYVTNTLTPKGKPLVWVCNVSQPTMTVYSPKGTKTGIAIVVFPGGGYNALAMDLEGTEICEWLTSKGITAVLLKYRVPTPRREAYGASQMALEDAQRTLGLVRFHAAEWQIDPHKIGVIGFSAGGHLVAATSTHFDRRSYPAVDAADQESCRPDFAIACYPGHLWDRGEDLNLNPNVPVTTNTPPTFLLQAEDDHVDGVEQSLVYYIALKKAGVPVEMHLYAQGGHGFGLRPSRFPITEWPRLVETWLKTIGMISADFSP
jgi:acetyl esterase/lipase